MISLKLPRLPCEACFEPAALRYIVMMFDDIGVLALFTCFYTPGFYFRYNNMRG